jgi:hypothetical protein
MAKNEDWKGEHLIRGSITKQESKSEVRRLVSSIAHSNRRAKGIQHPAAKAHGQFILTALVDVRRERK